jgi:23S rRNA pseudouridine1911/1915/1917 synthase
VARELVVPPELDGARLDKAIAALEKTLSRASIKRAIDEGFVRVGGKRRAKGALVGKGETISIELEAVSSPQAPAVPTPDAPLCVRLERSDVLVVDKPAGQPTAPLRQGEKGTLANALVGRYPELAGIGYGPREPGLLHRLDTATSGLVIVARSQPMFEALREALREERLHKKYLLICAEEGLPDTGSIEHPLANHPKDGKRVLACVHPRDVMRYRPRPARTEYRVLERRGPWALVEAIAHKALRHQIRAHFEAIGHPLLGDVLYGGEPLPAARHALHASYVGFDGTKTIAPFEVTSALPDDLSSIMRT